MKINELINRYQNKENYFYRLRGSIGNEELLIYFQGRKMFDIIDNIITPNSSFFTPNSDNKAIYLENPPSKVVEDFNKLGFILEYNSTLYTNYENFFNEVKKMKKAKEFTKFIGLPIEELTLDKLISLEQIMETRINIYDNKLTQEEDFLCTKKESGEKDYQQKLMDKLNNNQEKLKLTKLVNSPFSPDSLPFEVEYGLRTAEKLKNINNIYIPDARIDNIIIDNNILKMVEIKLGTSVIAGYNGIHKHLIDIAHSIKNNIIEVNDFNKIINQRKKIFNNYNLDNKITNEVKSLEYIIICGYNPNCKTGPFSKNEVIRLLDKIYNMNAEEELKLTKSDLLYNNGKQSKSEKVSNKILEYNQNYKEFTKMDIPTLIEYLKNKNIKVSIYLATYNYTAFKPYPIVK